MRRPFLSLVLSLTCCLLLFVPDVALADDGTGAAWWGPTLVSTGLSIGAAGISFWFRELYRRQAAVQDEVNRQFFARMDRAEAAITSTREQYATKAEMRELDASIRAQLLDVRQQLERRVDKVEERLGRLEQEMGGLRTDMNRLLEILAPPRTR